MTAAPNSSVVREPYFDDGTSAISIIALTQNIGAIEASDEAEVSADAKARLHHWMQGLSTFLDQAAFRMGALDLVVLHVQELGGKKFNGPFNLYFSEVVKKCFPRAAWCSGLLMPAEECDHTFTAMGTIIFASARILPLTSILSVKHRVYVALQDDPHSFVGSSEYLFHGAKFSNAEKSRKGFLLTSIRIGNKIVNFVNLHLFHDADNNTAVKESPSAYVIRRREALTEALQEISPVVSPADSLLCFGDFNFRLDGRKLLDHLSANFEGKLEMDKKAFTAPQPVYDYFNHCEAHLEELLQFDCEGAEAMETCGVATGIELGEFRRNFRPTYAYAVPKTLPESGSAAAGPPLKKLRSYNFTRLPAWCDRVLFNPVALAHMLKRGAPPPTKTAGEALPLPSGRYAYDSVSLSEMDHEAVFLLVDFFLS